MLTAVWAAVVAAAAAFVIGVGVAIYVMLKAARLMTESSATLASLRERENVLIDRASTAIDQVGEQIAMTETITASMDDVTASMAELRGRITALTPAAGPWGCAGPRSTDSSGVGQAPRKPPRRRPGPCGQPGRRRAGNGRWHNGRP